MHNYSCTKTAAVLMHLRCATGCCPLEEKVKKKNRLRVFVSNKGSRITTAAGPVTAARECPPTKIHSMQQAVLRAHAATQYDWYSTMDFGKD